MKKFFKALIPLLIYLAVSIIVPVIISLVKVSQFTAAHAGDVNAITEYSLSLAADKGYIQAALIGTQVVALIVFLLIYFVGMKKKINTISGHFTAVSFPLIIIGFIAFEIVISCVLFIIQAVAPSALEAYSQMMEASGLADLSVMSTILTLVGAPIVEEICFRGITMKWAKEYNSKFWVANVFQAALFGVAHMNIVQGIYAFILGLCLGYIANKYKSLWASIVAHVAFNFSGTYIVMLCLGKLDEGLSAGLFGVLIASLAVFAIAAFFVTKDKSYVEPVAAEEVVASDESVSE